MARLYILARVSRCSLPSTFSLSPQCLPVYRFRLLVLALTLQHHGQIIHALQSLEMLPAQYLLPQPPVPAGVSLPPPRTCPDSAAPWPDYTYSPGSRDAPCPVPSPSAPSACRCIASASSYLP